MGEISGNQTYALQMADSDISHLIGQVDISGIKLPYW